MRIIVAVALLTCLSVPGARAGDTVAEIDYLLRSIGSSRCTFIRNSKQYTAEEAEAHLRMKYRFGKRHATTSEKFIAQLASVSSVSKKPYYLKCEGEDKMPSGDWLTHRLNEYRTAIAKM